MDERESSFAGRKEVRKTTSRQNIGRVEESAQSSKTIDKEQFPRQFFIRGAFQISDTDT